MSVRSQKINIEDFLSDECINRFVRYLEAYRRVEANYGLFDKLARPRDIEDFTKAIYESVRVEERVLAKLNEGLKSGDYKLTIGEANDVKKLFSPGKECIGSVLNKAKDRPRLVGAILASLALSSELIQEKR